MSENKNFFDELNKLAGSAFGTAVHAKDELVAFIKHQTEHIMKTSNFISRDEFEAMRETIANMQREIEDLKKKK